MDPYTYRFVELAPGCKLEEKAEKEKWATFESGEEIVLRGYVWEVGTCVDQFLTLVGLRRYRPCPKCESPMAPEQIEQSSKPQGDRKEPPWRCRECGEKG